MAASPTELTGAARRAVGGGRVCDPTADFEARWLLRILAADFDASASDELTSSDQWSLDWRRLLYLAERHRVVPQLHRQLAKAPGGVVPEAITAGLHRFQLSNAARNLQLGTDLHAVVTAFETHGIRTLPIKGPLLAIAAYGDEAARQNGDLDLLVDPADYVAAQRVLSERGLRLQADWGWESSYTDSRRMLSIDVHRRITASEFRLALSFRELHARRAELTFRGRALPCLSLEDMLLVQCIQVAKDGWSRVSVLAKLCDVTALIRTRHDLDWERAVALARRHGCRRILGVGLILSQQLLRTDVPQVVRQSVVDPEAEHVAARITDDLVPGTRPDAAVLDDTRYYLAVRERWRDRRLPGIARWLQRALRPNERDRACVALPPFLAPGYYVVRPLRLGNEWVRRALGSRGRRR